MQVPPITKPLGAVVVGLAVIGGAAACAGRGAPSQGGGPMGELTGALMANLQPEGARDSSALTLARHSTRTVRVDGAVRGSFDGTRLLSAADAHRFGTPAISDPARDVTGDGIATFNEVRHVVRHFDTDASLGFDREEARAFEAAVGIRWIPA